MKTFRCRLLILLLLISAAESLSESARPTAFETLQKDYRQGRLTEAQYVAYQLLTIRGDEELPEAYRRLEQPTIRLGTGLTMAAHHLLQTAQGDDYRLLRQALSRPTHLPYTKISPAKKFRLHYALEGPDAVADAFLLEAAKAFDDAYFLIVEELGYTPPPADPTDGPEYDVYIHNIIDYGFTTPEQSSASSAFPYGYTSFVQIDNDFISTYTKGIDGMKVTAAHEFFHMVQMGIRTFTSTRLDTRWFYEACASWMEDVAYDHINDYLQYLPHYFSHLDESLQTFNGMHEYGAAVFFHMLEKKHGRDIIRRFWETFAEEDLYDALEQVLKQNRSSLANEIMDHMVWNYFTGSRSVGDAYYPEGTDYPEVKPNLRHEVQENVVFSDETQLLSGRYAQIMLQRFGDLSVRPQSTFPNRWRYAVVVKPLNLDADVYWGVGNEASMIADLSAAHEITVITANIGIPQNDMKPRESYQYQITLGETSGLASGIRKIFPNPFFPDQHPNGMRIDVRLIKRVRELGWVIMDENARAVYRKDVRFDAEKCGDFSFWWNGLSEDGRPVPPGVYFIFINAEQNIPPRKFILLR